MIRKKKCVAMLLAGGQGSRLYALTNNIAKPAFSVNLPLDLFLELSKNTNTGAVNNNVTTYPGFGANRIAIVLAAIKAAENPTI